jgi:DNA-binding CsgD family transcriptional regulator
MPHDVLNGGPGSASRALPAAALRRLLAAIDRIHEREIDIEGYARHAPAVLKDLCEADAIAYAEMDWKTRGFRANWSEPRPDYPALLQRYAEVMDGGFVWTGHPSGKVQGFSDFMSLPKLKDQPAFQETLRPLHVCFNMVFGFTVGDQVNIQFGCYRGPPRDFGIVHRRMIEAFTPHLRRAYETALLRTWRNLAPEKLLDANGFDLSPRQREVLGWLLAGKSNVEIAIILGISAETAKLHVSAVYRRLGVGSRVGAALKVARHVPAFIPVPAIVDVGWDGNAR